MSEDQQLFEFDTFVLDVSWDRPSSDSPVLPSLVGPFPTEPAAEDWAKLNVPNGSWEVRPLAWPHWVSPAAAFRRGAQAAARAVADVVDEAL